MAAYFTRKGSQPRESGSQSGKQADACGDIGPVPRVAGNRPGQQRHEWNPINEHRDMGQRPLVYADDHTVADARQTTVQDLNAMQAVSQPAPQHAAPAPLSAGTTRTFDLGTTCDPREVAVDDGHLTLFLKHRSVAQT
jgi:hypothetical protein